MTDFFRSYRKYIQACFYIASAILAIVGSFVMLEYGSATAVSATIGSPLNIKAHLIALGLPMSLVNMMPVAVVWTLVYVVFGRVWLSGLITSVVMGFISIINYYVAQLHGMPLSFLSLRNFSTALDVLENYEIELNGAVIKILIMLAMLVAFYLVFWYLTRKNGCARGKRVWIRNTVLVLLCCVGMYVGYYSSDPIKPEKTITWLWTEAYSKYGYVACTMETLEQMNYVSNMPDGYSVEKVNELPIAEEKENEYKTPDIILILNESFYDLSQITDIETDISYLGDITAIDGLASGYAVVPGNGGGTNSAEYELLTSNSLELMPGITPFNTLDLNQANSIVSHLEALGYSTFGTHSESSTNYSRKTGYTALGFDDIRFQDQYSYLDSYYNRNYASDKCLYEHLTSWYEEMPEDVPRFMYMLTIQNHGGYIWNDPEHDIVHAENDYDEYDDDVDEFLTAIYQSNQAFAELTEYFSCQDRPVIICMVGDHSPAFAKEIVDAKYAEDERSLRLRKVPLLVWANYNLKEVSLGTISMNYVVPTLLDMANVKMSPFYRYQLELKKDVPVLTSYGNYYDREGNLYRYANDTDKKYAGKVDSYFYLEYHNLEKDRNQELFEP